MGLKDILSSNGLIYVSKELARKIGLNAALLFAELLTKESYYKGLNQLNSDGFFYCTIENLEQNTTLKERVQSKNIKILKELGLIEFEVRGMPATRYFKCCSEETLQRFMFDKPLAEEQFRGNDETSFTVEKDESQFRGNDETSFVEMTKQVSSKPRSSNNQVIINKDNKEKEKDMAQVPSSQKTFFNLPEKEVAQSKKKLTQVEQSQVRITSAKKTNDWSSVTDTNFTHYYIQRHNELGFTEIAFDRYSSVGIMRDAFIKRFEIPKEKVCDFIDEVLKVYSTHPTRRDYDYLSFNMLNKVPKLMQDIMRSVDSKLRPPKQKYRTIHEEKPKNTVRNDSEQFKDDMF